jgi:hypothetical protein
MRTIRHSLQRHGSKISRVVLCLSAGVEEAAYVEAAALYFPRTLDEEMASCAATAGEQLDEFGDVLLGRSVVVGRMPSDTAALADGGRGSGGEGAGEQSGDWSQTLLRCDMHLSSDPLLSLFASFHTSTLQPRPQLTNGTHSSGNQTAAAPYSSPVHLRCAVGLVKQRRG